MVRGVTDYTEGVRVMERDFYGVVRTADHPSPVPYRSMYHGAIMHGGQLLGDSFRNTPADYFGPARATGACSPRCARWSRRSRSRLA